MPNHLPVLRNGNISDELLTEDDLVWIPQHLVSQDKMLRVGDIAMCISGIAGRSARVAYDWSGTLGAFCAIIRPESMYLSRLLAYWFRSQKFLEWRDSHARGATIQNLRTSELKMLGVPLPPIHEQQRIVATLDAQMNAVNLAKQAAEAALADVHALHSALLRDAFSGALR